MKRILVVALVAALCLVFAGCGSSSGYSAGEQFQLGDNTYALEKWERTTANDTSSSDGYSVCLLQVGNTAPIVISGFGSDNASMKSALEMTLIDGDTTYSAKTVGFAAIDDVEGYGSRITFGFDIPKGTDLPTSATLVNTSSGEESVQLNLKGLEVKEATTTTTTTTTTAPTTVAPTIGVDPNYDPEANKDIGDTDIYDPIESFDITDPDL